MNKKTILLLIPFAAAALAGCENANPTPPAPQCDSAIVTLDKQSITIEKNETYQLNATISVGNCPIQWASDNTAVATVANGLVTGVAKGTANISANGVVCVVTVTEGEEPIPVVHVESIAFAQNEYEIEKDAELTLEVSVTPSNATNKNVSYALSDVSPAEAVSLDGNKVKGLIPGGQATVTATSEDGGKTAQVTIKVKSETPPPTPVVHVTSVQFEKASYTVKVGSSVNVLASVLPENATEKGITYSLKDVSPAGCATISSNFVTGVAEGTATVVATAKDNGLTAEATITIDADAPDPEPVHKGDADDPYDANDAVIVANKLANNATTDKEFYIKGTAETAEFTKYASYSFEIGQGFLCYSLKNGAGQAEFKEGDIAIGDEVTVFAKITKFHQDAKDGKPERTILETKGGYVVEVKKPGEGTPVSIKEVVSGPLSVDQGDVLKASDYVIALNMSTGKTKNVTPTGIIVDTSVVGNEIPLTLEYTGLEPLTINIEVKKPAEKVVGDFYKVKNNAEITEGKYILVYEGGETAKVFNGLDAVNDGVDASASSGHIAANDNLVQVELESEGSGFALKVLSGTNAGKYIYNSDKSKAYMGFDASKKEHAVSLNEDGSIRIQDKNSEKALRYNSASDQQRFRYYAVDGQKPINLYKMHEAAPAELVSISVDSSQVKKEYYVGDSLDTTNLVVTAHYDDESEKVITSGYTIDPESFEEAGDNVAVTIWYNGKNAEPFNVKVNAARTVFTVTIVDYPEEITEGDEIIADDVLVDVTYSSGDPDEGVHPESVHLGEVLDGKADLTATVGDVTSSAVKVTVNPVQREALPYTGEVTNGALPAKWELSGSGATFATSYFALKGDGAAITASKLIDEQSAIKVAVKGVCNGTTTDSLVTVYALNDADEVVDSDTYVPAKASSTNAAQVEANSTVCEVALAGEGITGVKVELTTKGHNYVLMSVVISEDVPPVPPVLESIEVSTSEHREFYLNDPFVPETILAKYDKGDDVDVTEDALFEDYDMSTAGKQTVKVTYGEKETSYDITVLDAPAPAIKSISIDADDMLTEYYDGDDIDLTGVEVYAEYESGDPVKLDEDKYSLVCDPEQADIDSQKTTLTATLLDTEAGVEPATLDVDLTVTAKTAETILDFTQIDGFGDWTNSYSQHVVEYEDVTVIFDGVSKQGSTISDRPVGKDAPVTIVAKEGKNLQYFSAEFAKWNTNSQTVNVEYSTDYGKVFVDLGVSTSTFAIEKTNLPKGTSAIRFKPVNSTQMGYTNVVTNVIAAQEPDPVAVTGVSLDNEELIIAPTKTEQLVATIAPINATNKNVVWSVIEGDENVTVDQTGLVTGLKVGEGVVQVETLDGGFKATCAVTVSDDAPTTKEATLNLTGTKTSWDPLTVAKGENATYTVGEFKFNVYGGTASNACTANYTESYRTYSGSYIEISLPSDSKYASFASMTMNAGSKSASDNGGYKISASTIDDVTGTIKAATSSPAAVVVSDLKGATVIRISCTSGQLRYVSFNFVMNLK